MNPPGDRAITHVTHAIERSRRFHLRLARVRSVAAKQHSG